MRYRKFGKTGVDVSILGFGAMRLPTLEKKPKQIDEAQRIKNIGLTLKLIHDNIPKVRVLATGSSSIESTREINEPLTGRKREFVPYPLSYRELLDHTSSIEIERMLEHLLIYGCFITYHHS